MECIRSKQRSVMNQLKSLISFKDDQVENGENSVNPHIYHFNRVLGNRILQIASYLDKTDEVDADNVIRQLSVIARHLMKASLNIYQTDGDFWNGDYDLEKILKHSEYKHSDQCTFIQ